MGFVSAMMVLRRDETMVVRTITRPCAYRKGSTGSDNRKEPPQWCRSKGCDGLMTEGIMKRCDRYIGVDG